ncbi:F-box only protein 11-like [Stylophora pistillata]|uniref:F-box only protein 11-like n=1 Tax=Stylophora pistillata TaxID=50429 RepID=UPI000C04D97E|nr:F-box only protein 11-like [Stylophora pistillata]
MSSSKRPRLCTEYYRKSKKCSSNLRGCSLKRDRPRRKCSTDRTSMDEKYCRLESEESIIRFTRNLDTKSSPTRSPNRKRSCKLTSSTNQRSSSQRDVSNCYIKAVPDEVLLQICSYLQEGDLCHMAQTCNRLNTICQDGCLWRSLYSQVFEMANILIKNSEGIYINQEPENDLCWKKSFCAFYHAHHVYPTTAKQRKLNPAQYTGRKINYHETVKEALDAVQEDGIIIVHSGVYYEELSISKPVAIIGAAKSEDNPVVIQCDSSTVVSFNAGSGNSFLGHVTLKNNPNGESEVIRSGCVEVVDDCAPSIYNCKLTSLASAGATVYVHGRGARPMLSKCFISDSENVGIFITDDAQGTYEDCEITNIKLAGVWVRNHASPIMRRNKVHHGRDVGFFIFDYGLGYYEGNDVYNNRIAGFEIRSHANPTVVGCKIHHGMTGGIYCHDDARGEFLENKIYSNTYAGVWITSQSNPTIKNNEIYGGQQGGVYVFGEGKGLIEGNNIHDNALAGIQIRTKSNPIVRCNRIHSGLHGGIYVHEEGIGLIEDNEINNNTLAGVWITTGSTPTLRNNRIHSGKQVGVYFYDGGCGILEENEIFNHKYSGIQIRSGSNPCIRRNKIWGGQNGGVLVYNGGLGLLEENEIFDNAMAGVWIKTESNPVLRRNKIHDGREGGVCVFNHGKGVLENNDIFRNALTGVLISTASFPVLKSNRIFDGGAAGIEITNSAGGVLEENEVFNNRFDGICLATGVEPKLSNNKVHGNRREVEKAIESCRCLYQVSGNTCFPMHDFYRCTTCGTSDGYAICVSCVKGCHEGHDVKFVRRDRFFCDCGAGSSGVLCKLVSGNCWSVTSRTQAARVASGGQTETSAQEVRGNQALCVS